MSTDYWNRTSTPPRRNGEGVGALVAALRPLAAIADAYDANNLDDEARRFGGMRLEHENAADPATIELYQWRGGKRLLTLADCFAARDALKAAGF